MDDKEVSFWSWLVLFCVWIVLDVVYMFDMKTATYYYGLFCGGFTVYVGVVMIDSCKAVM